MGEMRLRYGNNFYLLATHVKEGRRVKDVIEAAGAYQGHLCSSDGQQVGR